MARFGFSIACSCLLWAGLFSLGCEATTQHDGTESGSAAHESTPVQPPAPLAQQPSVAVSEPVARAMAEGALRASGADVAVSVTGFAGPAGPDDEPGLVHFAVAALGAPTEHEEHHFGDIGRGPVRLECLRVALRMIEGAVTNR